MKREEKIRFSTRQLPLASVRVCFESLSRMELDFYAIQEVVRI
jgi:hypothetical protein